MSWFSHIFSRWPEESYFWAIIMTWWIFACFVNVPVFRWWQPSLLALSPLDMASLVFCSSLLSGAIGCFISWSGIIQFSKKPQIVYTDCSLGARDAHCYHFILDGFFFFPVKELGDNFLKEKSLIYIFFLNSNLGLGGFYLFFIKFISFLLAWEPRFEIIFEE